MKLIKRISVLLLVVLAVAGCDPEQDKPEVIIETPPPVEAGTPCDQPNAEGKTVSGINLICRATEQDPVLRWRVI